MCMCVCAGVGGGLGGCCCSKKAMGEAMRPDLGQVLQEWRGRDMGRHFSSKISCFCSSFEHGNDAEIR